MLITIRGEVAPIKAGWRATSPDLHLATEGRNPTLAILNLQRTARLALTALQRGGGLEDAVKRLGLHTSGDDGEIEVLVVYAERDAPPPDGRPASAGREG